MSTSDAFAALASFPGVSESVESVRHAVDQVYRHRVMRRRSNEVTSEAALRGARASAACEGADWPLEEVRRRTDFGADAEGQTLGAALRLTAEAGQLIHVWGQSPLQVLARLHLVAASGNLDADRVGRPRRDGELVEGDGLLPDVTLPSADETAARLDGLARLLVAGSAAPALVVAAVVHGELLALRPFASLNGLVARSAQRIVLVAAGLDPKAVCPAEVGFAELGHELYREKLEAYMSGTPSGLARWIGHCAEAVCLGARETMAVCEALQRGAA